MSSILKFRFVALCLSVSACATQPSPTTHPTAISAAPSPEDTTADAQSAEIRELADDEIWAIDANDNYTHIQSGFICPKNWTGFERRSATIYHRSGVDVGCNYLDETGSIVTLYAYAYSNRGPLDDELASIMETVVKTRHPVYEESGVLVVAEPAERRFGYVGDAILVSKSDGAKIKTGVFLSDAGPWRLKARVTYLADQATRVESFAGISLQGQWDRIIQRLISEIDT